MLTFAKSHFQVGIMVYCSHPYYLSKEDTVKADGMPPTGKME